MQNVSYFLNNSNRLQGHHALTYGANSLPLGGAHTRLKSTDSYGEKW